MYTRVKTLATGAHAEIPELGCQRQDDPRDSLSTQPTLTRELQSGAKPHLNNVRMTAEVVLGLHVNVRMHGCIQIIPSSSDAEGRDEVMSGAFCEIPSSEYVGSVGLA